MSLPWAQVFAARCRGAAGLNLTRCRLRAAIVGVSAAGRAACRVAETRIEDMGHGAGIRRLGRGDSDKEERRG